MFPAMRVGTGEDAFGNALQRQLAGHGPDLKGGAGHAIDDAARLVLADGLGTGMAQGEQPTCTVAPKAGKDDTNAVRA
jgi:hypothetical protein